MIKKIAITGPESTGKTWLAENLSQHFKAGLVEEYSRQYFQNREYRYDISDLDKIADGQLKNEEKMVNQGNQILICDTDMMSIKIWSEVVFSTTSDYVENLVNNHNYDLYLLCNLDVDWEQDTLRKNYHNRQYIYNLFVNELKKRSLKYFVVEGKGNKRYNNAVELINNNLQF